MNKKQRTQYINSIFKTFTQFILFEIANVLKLLLFPLDKNMYLEKMGDII